jgi:hypothetical protein
MLYRIQTLYLLISIFIYSIIIYFSFNLIIDFFYFNLKKTIQLFIITCLFLSTLSFFLFKKKKLQIFLNKINILVNIIHGLKLTLFFSCGQLNQTTLILLLITFCTCILLCISANIAIKKDIELISSINRIR